MLNKAIHIGYITKDLKLEKINVKGESMSKVDFSIGVNNKKDEKATFVPCTVFGKQADNMVKYLHKGSKIYVEGYLNINNYTNKNGEKKTFTKVNVNKVVFLDSKKNQEAQKVQKNLEKANEHLNSVFSFDENI